VYHDRILGFHRRALHSWKQKVLRLVIWLLFSGRMLYEFLFTLLGAFLCAAIEISVGELEGGVWSDHPLSPGWQAGMAE
jgi:uncharacterized membrane protein